MTEPIDPADRNNPDQSNEPDPICASGVGGDGPPVDFVARHGEAVWRRVLERVVQALTVALDWRPEEVARLMQPLATEISDAYASILRGEIRYTTPADAWGLQLAWHDVARARGGFSRDEDIALILVSVCLCRLVAAEVQAQQTASAWREATSPPT